MCTLIVLHRCVPGSPLVIAANRDEFLARPAEDFAVRASRTGPILSPLDLEAGGTWVGLSQRGVFAGLTNLRPLADATGTAARNARNGRDLRSRGDVVMAALEASNAHAAADALADLEPHAYNPFQLVVADLDRAYLIVYRGTSRVIPLEPGPHIVGNVEDEAIASLLDADPEARAAREAGFLSLADAYPGFGGVVGEGFPSAAGKSLEEPRALKLTRIRSHVERLVEEPGFDLFEGLARICREHVNEDGIDSPFEATCVHIPDVPRPAGHPGASGTCRHPEEDSETERYERYGTRSSLLLELSEDDGSSRFWATDGAPCRHPFENRSSLLKELGLREPGSRDLGAARGLERSALCLDQPLISTNTQPTPKSARRKR